MTHNFSLPAADPAIQPRSSDPLRSLLGHLWKTNRPLTLAGLASLILLAAAAVLGMIDPRLVAGAPAWFKPMKFAISTAFYTLTLVWMLGHVRGHPRLVSLIGSAIAIGMSVEVAWIVMQAARGVRSHFNISTPFDETAYSLMGLIVLGLWLLTAAVALLVMRQRLASAALAWSLRLGLLISLAGMSVGFLMTGRLSPAQRAELEADDRLHYAGAHSVGVEDGGPGLPFVGWSTEGGDLRVAHFVGLHGLQVIPLAGLAVQRLFGGVLSDRRRTALVWAAGLSYLALIGLLTWQALRGQPLLAPDTPTLSALGMWAGGTLLAGGLAFVRAKRAR